MRPSEQSPEPDPPAPGGPAEPGLRAQALRGGGYLAVREGLGMLLRFGGLLMLVRIIGSAEYGRYAGPLAIVATVSAVARFGTDYHLLRQPRDVRPQVEHQAFTFLLLTSLTAAALLGLVSLLSRGGTFDDLGFGPVLAVMALGVPINVLWVPAQARLERELRFRRLALLELGGDVAFFAVALPLAVAGAGAWAGVAGYLVWQTWLLVASLVVSGYRPRLVWSRPLLRGLLSYGSAQGPSAWLHIAQPVVNPLVVGPLLGPAAVGRVALGLRLTENLGFVVRATFRLGTAALGRVQHDDARLGRAHAESMALQVLAGGAPLAAFALFADALVPAVFGEEFAPVAGLFPWLGMGMLVSALFNLHVSVCWVKARSLPVVAMRGLQLVILAAVSAALVPHLGTNGFGVAYLLAALAGASIHFALLRWFVPHYGPALTWMAAWLPVLVSPWLGWPWPLLTVVPGLAILARPATRATLAEYVRVLRRAA